MTFFKIQSGRGYEFSRKGSIGMKEHSVTQTNRQVLHERVYNQITNSCCLMKKKCNVIFILCFYGASLFDK